MKIFVASLPDLKRINVQRYHHILGHLSTRHEVVVGAVEAPHLGELNDPLVDHSLRNVDFRYGGIGHPLLQERNIGKECAEVRPDIVVSFHSLLGARSGSKKAAAPLVMDICDDVVDWMGSSPRIPALARPVARWTAKRLLRRSIRQSARVVCSVDALREEYGIARDACTILPNGVDADHFRDRGSLKRSELGISPDTLLIGFVGYLGPWIDMNPWLVALSRWNLEAKLLVVGGGDRLPALQSEVARLGLGDRVICTGNVAYTSVPDYVSASDVCILPFDRSSVSRFALPLKLFEYMACERPVITSDLRTVRDAVGDRVRYVNSPEHILSALDDVRAGPSRNLLRANREFVKDHYSWKSICARYEELLHNEAT